MGPMSIPGFAGFAGGVPPGIDEARFQLTMAKVRRPKIAFPAHSLADKPIADFQVLLEQHNRVVAAMHGFVSPFAETLQILGLASLPASGSAATLVTKSPPIGKTMEEWNHLTQEYHVFVELQNAIYDSLIALAGTQCAPGAGGVVNPLGIFHASLTHARQSLNQQLHLPVPHPLCPPQFDELVGLVQLHNDMVNRLYSSVGPFSEADRAFSGSHTPGHPTVFSQLDSLPTAFLPISGICNWLDRLPGMWATFVELQDFLDDSLLAMINSLH